MLGKMQKMLLGKEQRVSYHSPEFLKIVLQCSRCDLVIIIKFIYSEKATKFCEISTLNLTALHTVKSKVEISQNFVGFSEYMNFMMITKSHLLHCSTIFKNYFTPELIALKLILLHFFPFFQFRQQNPPQGKITALVRLLKKI